MATVPSVLDRLRKDLKLKNRSDGTIDRYVGCARTFLSQVEGAPTKVHPDVLRDYALELGEGREPSTVKTHVAAIRFLYEVTLRRPKLVET